MVVVVVAPVMVIVLGLLIETVFRIILGVMIMMF